MKNNRMEKGYLRTISPKIKMKLVSLVDDFYCIEKQHTVVIMPFFGLLHSQGNESKPFLNYVDINILDLMKSQFKNVIVYPGENPYLSSYKLPLSSVEHLSQEQNLLSRIVNKTTNFDSLSAKHEEILRLYEQVLANFDTMKLKHPLPYKTAFNIQTPEDLISFAKLLDKKIKQKDSYNKICLVCPISYLIEHPIELYASIVDTIKSIGGNLYFAQNQSDRYLYTNANYILYNEQYDEKIVQSIQDFANTYNKDITRMAKKKLHFNSIIDSVQNGKYGYTEKEIIDNLEHINIENIYYTTNFDNEEILSKK